MKKIDLVHTTILIVAILAGYSALEYIFYLLSNIASAGEFYYLRGQSWGKLTYYLVMAVLFAATAVILVRNGRKYAGAILRDEPEGSWEDAAQLQLDRSNIILVLIIGMGLYTLIQSIPYALNHLYEIFKDKVGSELLKDENPDRGILAVEILRVTIGAFLIYAAPALTNFINKNIAVRLDSK